MPFVSRRSIASNVRRQADKAYQAQLRQALGNPALTPEQRANIKMRLSQIGGQRIYDAQSPPPPGAMSFPPNESRPEHPETEQQLRTKMKSELITLAGQSGLPTSGTKARLIERLLARYSRRN